MNLILLNTDERGSELLDDAYVKIAVRRSAEFKPKHVAFCLPISERGIDVGYGEVLYSNCTIKPKWTAVIQDIYHVKERALLSTLDEYTKVQDPRPTLIAGRIDEELCKKVCSTKGLQARVI